MSAPERSHLFLDVQFSFRPGRITVGLLLLLFSKDWHDAMDESLDTLVVVLDIAGAFGRVWTVWHPGLIEKLRVKGVQGDLMPLKDYLHGRTLQLVINGQPSRPFTVQAEFHRVSCSA